MNLLIKKSTHLTGSMTPPGSKSQTIRALLLGLLSNGETIIQNRLDSDDVGDAMRMIESMDATLSHKGAETIIKSRGTPLDIVSDHLYSGNSGITTHFMLPILGLRKDSARPIILDCGEQMRSRPIASLVRALNKLGMTIEYIKKQGCLPVGICGELSGGIAEVDGVTSQYLSALLLALPCAKNDSVITVKNLQERPYVEMTLAWLRKFDIKFSHEQIEKKDTFYIKGNQRYKNFSAEMPGDFSSASYLIAAAALTKSDVTLRGMDRDDIQGDKRIISILQEMGADIQFEENKIFIKGGKELKGIKIDASDIPDLIPTLAVIGTQASGKMEILNVKHARIKETDRIHSMCEGLMRMGAKITELEDGMVVYQSSLKAAEVHGYGDHRTVMALAIAGMSADGVTIIDDYETVNKTFPTFVSAMQSIGATMEIQS